MEIEFPDSCKKWDFETIEDLYHIPIKRDVIENSKQVVANIKN